ncbi:MAG: aminopeptidase [Actinomycetia bacterium]|nr:aminopeptidase [Actinomycetes bacterium]
MNAEEFQNNLEKYAQLVIHCACNIQPGQELVISANLETIELVRLLTEAAYQAGARRVTVRLGDERLTRLSLDYAALAVYEEFPDWLALLHNGLGRQGAAFLHIESADPQALAGADPQKLIASQRAGKVACAEYYDALYKGGAPWCIIGAASPAWAEFIWPELDPAMALERLWQAIFHAARVDQADPAAAWQQQRQNFQQRISWLNTHRFQALHYQNSRGTDLTIGLNPEGLWQGGGDVLKNSRYFFPNLPTEEIFTAPDWRRADGLVQATMPLVYNGSVIDGFWLRLEQGRVVDFQAAEGQDVLAAILATDDGARSLGECALVPWSNPIRQTGILFYSTLFDENAACHLALGSGYPDCLAGGLEMTDEQLQAAGVNKSATHVDFMLGSADLSIQGIDAQGNITDIFENGEWSKSVGADRQDQKEDAAND